MSRLSHRDRIMTILAGEKPDRYAASFWRHFYHMEHHAEGTIQAMLDFQKHFDWDFIKINMRADYHVEDWGLKQRWSHDEFKKHTKYDFPVKEADDWYKITALEPTSPVLAEHLEVVSGIRKGAGRDIPILMTVFTPLAIAGRMVEDNATLIDHLRMAPDNVESALRAITDTFVAYAAELRNAGADGLFYATTQWASSDSITWQEYERFGVPYDLEVIQATEGDAINLLHVCGNNNYLKQLSQLDYNASMYNWDSSQPTNLPLDRAYDELPDKTLVGGVDHKGWLVESKPEEIAQLVDRLKSDHDPSRLIIGPGCSIPPETPMENLQAIREQL
jgi:uroporphyrinogen decarboxylase